MRAKFPVAMALCGIITLAAVPAAAQSIVTVAWDASTDATIVGYMLSWGTQSGNYTSTVDVGNRTSHSVTGLTAGARYYFSVRAYNAERMVSNPSNEVSFLASFQSDLLWQEVLTGKVVAWHVGNDQSLQSWNYWSEIDLAGWKAVASGDFNRDGFPDFVWQQASTGKATVWYLGRDSNGATVRLGWNYISEAGVPGWSVVGAGDFNRDGRLDLVWQNDATRQVSVWYLGGTQGNTMLGWGYLSSNGVPGWLVSGVADFDGNGRPDLVWQNQSTAQATVWYFGGAQGNTLLGWSYLASGGMAGWKVAGARDFNGDGKPDLVWQNDATQKVTVWFLTGAQGNVFAGWNYLSADGVSGWRAFAR